MEISQFMTIVSILLGIGIAGSLFQRLWAAEAKHQGEGYCFANLQSYLPIFKKGLKIVYQNSWIFWLIFGIYLLNFVYDNIVRFFIVQQHPSAFGIPLPGQDTILLKITSFLKSHTLWALRDSARNIGAFSNMLIGNPLIILVFLIFAWPLRKFLNSISDSNFTASESFLRKNFWPTVGVAGVVLIFAASVLTYSLRFVQQFQKFWDPPIFLRIEIIPHLYLSAVIISLIEGAILTVFREGRDRGRVPRAVVISGTVAHFKSLFFFNILFIATLDFPSVIFLFKKAQAVFFGKFYSYYYRWLINFVFLLVIYLIVGRGYNFESGLKENFLLWRRRFPEIIVFMLIGISLLWVPHLLYFGRFPRPFWYIEAVAIGIKVFARLWIAATLMLFVLTITETQAEKSDS